MDTEVHFDCPVCGTAQWTECEPGGGSQDFVHDCAICCRPMIVRVHHDPDGRAWAETRPEDA